MDIYGKIMRQDQLEILLYKALKQTFSTIPLNLQIKVQTLTESYFCGLVLS